MGALARTHTALALLCTSGLLCAAYAGTTQATPVASRVPFSGHDARPLTITPQPPMLPADTGQGVTDSSSFSLFVQTTSGTTLACDLDKQPVACGPSPPSCAGTACAMFTASGQTQGIHFLDVTVTDAAGHSVDEMSYAVTVNLSPPDSTNLQLNDGTDGITPRPLHPVFAFAALDANQPLDGDGLPDSGQCSFTPAGAPPVWSPCAPHEGYDDDEEFQYSPTVPATHVDYVFQGRAVDAFGRVDPTPVSMPYDPVPCDVQVSPGKTVRRLLGASLTATVRCTGSGSAAIELFLLGVNGRVKPLSYVLARHLYPLVLPTRVSGSAAGFTVQSRLRISDSDILISAEKTVAHARSLSLAVVVEPRTDLPYDPLPGSAQITLTKGNPHRKRRSEG